MKPANRHQPQTPHPQAAFGYLPQNIPAAPAQLIRAARSLHARLLQAALPAPERSQIAREIAGLLFTAEANIIAPNRARILFLRLRTHAHLFSQPNPPMSRFDTVWTSYDELEALV